jgi:hypothetical protein
MQPNGLPQVVLTTPSFALALLLLTGLSSCSPIHPPERADPYASAEALALPPQWTPTAFATSTILDTTATPTISKPPLEIILPDLFPGDRDGRIWFSKWLDDDHLAVAYTPFPPYSPEAELTAAALPLGSDSRLPLGWVQYDVATGLVSGIPSPLPFDISFWDRNNIVAIADYPELYGYFSPSGNKVMYNVWHGSVFDPDSTTDIFVQDTRGGGPVRVYEFGYSNVYVLRAEWTRSEEVVYFTATYEGPAQMYVADLRSGLTRRVSEATDWDGVTEDTFRLSPDGSRIAAVNSEGRLIFVSIPDGTVAETSYAVSVPIWIPSGEALYAWRGSMWTEISGFRVFDATTLQSQLLFDASDLADAVRFHGLDVDLTDEEYLMGGIYAVSPSGRRLFLPETIVGPLIVDLSTSPGA